MPKALPVSRSANPRLLLIDDEPHLADYLAQVASLSGFQPIITATDEDFRTRFLEDRPEMVAIDLGMPGMDGVELLRFLAANDCKAPVLIVSGFDSRVLDSAYRLGQILGLNMAGSLAKPVGLDDLEALFKRLRPSLVA